MYGSWDIEQNKQNFLSVLTAFNPFTPLPPPPNYLENQYFEKLKKTPQDTIILQMCSVNDNHMIYGSMVPEIWNMTDIIFCHSRQFFATLLL